MILLLSEFGIFTFIYTLCDNAQVNLNYLNGAASIFKRILNKAPSNLDVINYSSEGEITTSISYPLTQTCYSIN